MNVEVNNFVQYLNTLHRCNGNNTNSTAESNLQNPFSESLLVEDEKLINKIMFDLKEGNGKVLLTGFAGDGKTTIAHTIVKTLTDGSIIDRPIQTLRLNGSKRKLVVIKDLSENSLDLNDDIVTNYIIDKSCSLLLVSNSGAIIHRLKEAHNLFNYDRAEDVEKIILNGISENDIHGFGSIELDTTKLSVVNLVNHDNIPTARKILEKIVNHRVWSNIDENKYEKHPILINVKALRNQFVVDRLFLMYQRLFEYGHRFTLRNFVEHFSYMITGNLSLNRNPQEVEPYLFYNNVFGKFNYDCVNKSSLICNDIVIIKVIREQLFGSRISSNWKRKIWNKVDNSIEENILSPFNKNYHKYSVISCSSGPNLNRLKLYRIVYFLLSDDKIDYSFTSDFLNSPGLGLWKSIQSSKSLNSSIARTDLFNSLRHVIKEYFAGLKLPVNESDISRNKVYITMNRKKEISQSAQVVLALLVWDLDDKVCLNVYSDFRNKNQFELLAVKESSNKKFRDSDISFEDDCISLKLPLPFLDYLLNTNSGALKDSSYLYFEKRLDFFKRDIMKNLNRKNADSNDLLLVRIKPDRNLGDIKFVLKKDLDKLEVQ
jgi:hypothetical protein